ncbi:MAG: (Fe-S)-binding protein [Chloroflexota bacterium]
MNILQDLIKENRVWYCLDCGKCSSICPITRWETRQHTGPRLLVEKSIQGRGDDLMDDPLFWACLTCKRCTEICPSGVNFSEFVRGARNLARSFNRTGDCTHSEMIQTWGRMMTNPDMRQSRLTWVREDMKFSEDSDTIYFVGCIPYFDPLFAKIGMEGVKIAQAAVRVMNHLGIKPQVLADERCCGHDQLWEGDVETFQALARINIERFKATNAKRIVTTCSECVRTLKLDYPQYVGGHGMEVLHLSELLAQHGLSISEPSDDLPTTRVTYQDPCRLGRHLGIYDAPRQVIEGIGLELVEMERNRASSQCCGTSCWRACGQVSKGIQVERLQEAKATGAETLVTTCLKCQIHLKCAQNDPILGEKIAIEIRDLTTLVAERLTALSTKEFHEEVAIGDR